MDLKEMMILASGLDVNKMPKCHVVLMNEFWNQAGEIEVEDELVVDSAEVQFFAGDGFVTLDLRFGSKHNVDLGLTSDFINRFRNVRNSIDENAEKVPVTVITIMPEDYEDQYYIACVNPVIHCLRADKPTDELSIVRMMFFEDSCMLYENEESADEDGDESGLDVEPEEYVFDIDKEGE